MALLLLLGGRGGAAVLLASSTRPIPVYRPKELAVTPVLEANRTALTSSVGANESFPSKTVQHPYK